MLHGSHENDDREGVRQRWPEAERSLAEEGEITITHDGKPVAQLLPVEEAVFLSDRILVLDANPGRFREAPLCLAPTTRWGSHGSW